MWSIEIEHRKNNIKLFQPPSYHNQDQETSQKLGRSKQRIHHHLISLNEQVLDSRTTWNYEDRLAHADLFDKMFFMFDEKLEEEGFITHKGTIINASFVNVLKQCKLTIKKHITLC